MQTIRMTELEFIDDVHGVIWRVKQDLVQVIIEQDGKNIAVIQPFPAVFMSHAPTGGRAEVDRLSEVQCRRSGMKPPAIEVISPCSCLTDCPECHSFQIKNASSHETLFIFQVHIRGVRAAIKLAARLKWKYAHSIEELLDVAERVAQADFERDDVPVMQASARELEGRRLVVYPWKRHNHEKEAEVPNPAPKTPPDEL